MDKTLEQARLNGQKYLQNRRTIILCLSPGNPHYYKTDNLKRLFCFAERNADKIFLFIPDKIAEHNYRAVGSKNAEKSARVKANRLRNKCREVMRSTGCCDENYSHVKWIEDIEACSEYTDALRSLKDLFQKNDEFRHEIQETTEAALISMKSSRANGKTQENDIISATDLEEGVNYLLKEFAFFDVVPYVYSNCDEFVLIYHRSWPVLEKHYSGYYDGIDRSSLGFVVFQ